MSGFDWQQTNALLEKNIRYIKNSKKIFADVSKLKNLNEEDYRIRPCEDGTSLTIEKKTDKGYVRMHSAYEPMREGRILAERLINKHESNKTYIYLGFGFGYLFNYLLPLIAQQNGEIIVYEPSYDVFNYFIRIFDISKLFTGYPIKLFIHEKEKEIRDIFPHVIDADIAWTNTPTTRGYTAFFEKGVSGFVEEITEFFNNERYNKETIKRFSANWLNNVLQNIPYILKSINTYGFKGLLTNKPAIIVSAGPSLNKNVHLLKEVRGKVFIVAAYVTIKTLEANGIYPDLYVAIDPRQQIYNTGEEYEVNKVPVMLHSATPLEFYEMYKENYITLLQCGLGPQNVVMKIILNELNRDTMDFPIAAGGSVAHAIADLLRYMGVNRIVLLGQDLALTDGKHHADEYMDGRDDKKKRDIELLNKNTMMVEDIYGGKIATNISYEDFKKSFSRYAEYFKDSLEIIDATEGGAKIKHTKIMTFRDVIDNYLSEYTDPDFSNSILTEAREKGLIFNTNEQTEVKNTFNKIIKQNDNIMEIIDDALEAMQNVLKLFRFNKIPTEKELHKPVLKCEKYDKIIQENNLIIEMANFGWMAEKETEIAMQRADEHPFHYIARKDIALLTRHKESGNDCVALLKETVKKLEEEGI